MITETEKKILLVDDEQRLLDSIAKRVSLLGFSALKASSGHEAIDMVKENDVDLAIVDLKMPEMDGLVTITKLKELRPGLKTVLLTGYGSEKNRQATEALGSLYVEKDAMGSLWDIIKSASDTGKVVVINPGNSESAPSEPRRPEPPQVNVVEPSRAPQPVGKSQLPRLIGETEQMQRLRKNIERLSELDCPVILSGEAGTGKELIARTIHGLSQRENQQFMAFDCGCFSGDFRFRELIHVSFSGNISGSGSDSVFAGTVFLDHIANMPGHTQDEIVRILDGKADASESRMNIRLIVATQKNLEKKVQEGLFRKDLYQRLKTIELDIPPLRERKEDIPPLCRYFLDQYNRLYQKNVTRISPDVISAFQSYDFPGNVRELRHVIERAVIVSEDILEMDHLPRRFKSFLGAGEEMPDPDAPFLTLGELEQLHIIRALKTTGGNKSRAAELLGISRAALWRKLRVISKQT